MDKERFDKVLAHAIEQGFDGEPFDKDFEYFIKQGIKKAAPQVLMAIEKENFGIAEAQGLQALTKEEQESVCTSIYLKGCNFMAIGWKFEEQERWDDAIATYQKALKIIDALELIKQAVADPEIIKGDLDSERWDIQYAIGRCYQEQHRYDEAIRVYDKISHGSPDIDFNRMVWYALGSCYQKKRQYGTAIGFYRLASLLGMTQGIVDSIICAKYGEIYCSLMIDSEGKSDEDIQNAAILQFWQKIEEAIGFEGESPFDILESKRQQLQEQEKQVAEREAKCKQMETRLAKAGISNERIVDALQASLHDDDVFTRRAAIQIIEGLGDEGKAILEKVRAKRQLDDLRRTRS